MSVMLYSIIKINIHNLQNLQKALKIPKTDRIGCTLWSIRAKLLPVFVGYVGTVYSIETGKEKKCSKSIYIYRSIDIFNITTITGS